MAAQARRDDARLPAQRPVGQPQPHGAFGALAVRPGERVGQRGAGRLARVAQAGEQPQHEHHADGQRGRAEDLHHARRARELEAVAEHRRHPEPEAHGHVPRAQCRQQRRAEHHGHEQRDRRDWRDRPEQPRPGGADHHRRRERRQQLEIGHERTAVGRDEAEQRGQPGEDHRAAEAEHGPEPGRAADHHQDHDEQTAAARQNVHSHPTVSAIFPRKPRTPAAAAPLPVRVLCGRVLCGAGRAGLRR
ncbi:hypothetical protein AB0878_18050 [Amycolatopsis sp. NPDC047767]|uniref:hypothetical protein n=1 Tax=Amycolatopsis sp. NPDC047767 TaxID=3156765 RepID=UPI00345665B0